VHGRYLCLLWVYCSTSSKHTIKSNKKIPCNVHTLKSDAPKNVQSVVPTFYNVCILISLIDDYRHSKISWWYLTSDIRRHDRENFVWLRVCYTNIRSDLVLIFETSPISDWTLTHSRGCTRSFSFTLIHSLSLILILDRHSYSLPHSHIQYSHSCSLTLSLFHSLCHSLTHSH
jgi:hypothetical protein